MIENHVKVEICYLGNNVIFWKINSLLHTVSWWITQLWHQRNTWYLYFFFTATHEFFPAAHQSRFASILRDIHFKERQRIIISLLFEGLLQNSSVDWRKERACLIKLTQNSNRTSAATSMGSSNWRETEGTELVSG